MFSITYKKAGGYPLPKGKVMPKSSINERTRCSHRTTNGRRCQSPIAPKHRSLCAHHALQDLQHFDSKLVAEEILDSSGGFHCAFGINLALGKLFAATAENRIPPRTAAVLAYISQLMMQTLDPARRDVVDALDDRAMEVVLKDVYGDISTKLRRTLNAMRGDRDAIEEIENEANEYEANESEVNNEEADQAQA
jgi:hypothetical protein